MRQLTYIIICCGDIHSEASKKFECRSRVTPLWPIVLHVIHSWKCSKKKTSKNDLEDVLGVRLCLGFVDSRTLISVSIALSHQQTSEVPTGLTHQVVLQFAAKLCVTFLYSLPSVSLSFVDSVNRLKYSPKIGPDILVISLCDRNMTTVIF